MGLIMPTPTKIGDTYYLREHVPLDIADKVKGTQVPIAVGGSVRWAKASGQVKVSLRTKDTKEAKALFSEAHASLQAHWDRVREGGPEPVSLSHKQVTALAGEFAKVFIDGFDKEPGSPQRWDTVQAADDYTKRGGAHAAAVALGVNSNEQKEEWKAEALEKRFGALADNRLALHGLIVDAASRRRLITGIAKASEDIVRVNNAKAEGDYTDLGVEWKYPAFEAPGAQPTKLKAAGGVTFGEVIDKEVRRRSLGVGTKPLRSPQKYRIASDEFAKNRNSDVVSTVTEEEGDAWVEAMLEKGRLHANTIKQRLQNTRTVIQWAIDRKYVERFPFGNPLASVMTPEAEPTNSMERTLTLSEARTILSAARKEALPARRWVPWMCAYTGARVGELAQLRQKDFSQVEASWFCDISCKGGKTVKNAQSLRKIPIHSALIEEGLIDFVLAHDDEERLFPKSTQALLVTWIRQKVGIKRPEVAPNHGWRHLFEDLAGRYGMSDSAKFYITGRTLGHSSELYGGSEAMLPGLAREMEKIEPLDL
ncbi:MAG: DUF6538 domain-containing protein [Pseudomonadota bacterium]